jgi:hypothetical protein
VRRKIHKYRIFLIAGTAIAAGSHDHKPKHGGVVVEGKYADYELVAKPDTLQLYVRAHDKPKAVDKMTAKVTLLVGAEKQEVELKPAGEKFEAKGSFKVPAGTKAVVLVNADGKSSTARFVLK